MVANESRNSEKERSSMLKMDEFGRHCDSTFSNHKDGKGDDVGEVSTRSGWKKVLYDFSQNTTIHGVRQIGEDTPFTIRRFLWFLIVCGGMTAFVYQVVSSVLHYYEWPVTVDVRINYNNSLSFPAVTICNQNAFRVTAAHKHDLYNTVKRLFSSQERHRENPFSPLHANMSLADLYMKTAHTKDGLILSCEWHGKNCGSDALETKYTDFGKCYTFNHGQNGTKLRSASVTGADHGLRLTLNIEQYEYMHGPNSAAGLKLLVHHQDEIPMMRDMGQAIPPGSHALVGVEILQIMNLPHPHGVCDDSKKLTYFDRYSLPACYVDCKERWLAKKCSCRDIYMTSKDDYPSVCTINQYDSCMVKALEEFNSLSDNKRCDVCPIPCSRRLYDSTITYASTSNFDVDNLLRSKHVDFIRTNYRHAQETVQRVNDHVYQEYATAAGQLHQIYESVSSSVAVLEDNIAVFKNHLKTEIDDLRPRVWFHYERGLVNVKYIADHDFIRGFDIIAERALDHVTNGMFEIQNSFDQMLQASKSSSPQDKESRHIQYLIMDSNLAGKLFLVQRARDNITEVYDSYLTGRPLLTFRKTPDRRYDLTYISLELLRHNVKRQMLYFESLNATIVNLTDTMQTLRSIAFKYFDTGQINKTQYQHTIYWYIKACKGFNYRRFQIRDKIIYKAGELAKDRMTNFEKLNDTLYGAYFSTARAVKVAEKLIQQYRSQTGERIGEAINETLQYLTDTSKTKLALSRTFNAKITTDSLRAMRAFFTNIRLRAKDIQDSWRMLEVASQDIWRAMLTETTTKVFYSVMNSDINNLTASVPRDSYLTGVIAKMTRLSQTTIYQMNSSRLYEIVNADFPNIKLGDKEQELREDFEAKISNVDVNLLVGNRDDQLIETFEEFQTYLSSYERNLRIDASFLRSNLMKVDVFMKELSYQEIEQQKAYSLTNLWSDIGGSIGLFIGASVITVLEVVDVIIHNILLQHMRRK